MPDKKETLKSLIRSLHEGATVEEAKARFAEEIGSVDTAELVAIEQSLIEEGLTPEEVTRFCNVHVELVKDGLQEAVSPGSEPAAVTRLRSENSVIRGLVTRIRGIADSLQEGRPLNQVLSELEDELGKLRRVTHHYSLKENTVFPSLEQHGFTGPSQVMWEKDNEVRRMLRSVTEGIGAVDSADGWQRFARETLAPFLDEVDGMVQKEEDILFPAAMERFSQNEWAQVLIALDEGGPSFEAAEQPIAHHAEEAPSLSEGVIQMPSGHVSVAELVPMLNALPVDLTFVDADDRVAYFSEKADRVFMRTRSIIGRKVQNCHPPKSLDAVQRIIDSFKDGTSDSEDFWLTIEGRFIYIRYLAIRSGTGAYLGTMEVTQDATTIRSLEGEKRLAEG